MKFPELKTKPPKLTHARNTVCFLGFVVTGRSAVRKMLQLYCLTGERISHFRWCNYTISLCVYRQISQGY